MSLASIRHIKIEMERNLLGNENERITLFIRAKLLACEIEFQAMRAANQTRMSQGKTEAYDDDAFFALLDRYKLMHCWEQDLRSFIQQWDEEEI